MKKAAHARVWGFPPSRQLPSVAEESAWDPSVGVRGVEQGLSGSLVVSENSDWPDPDPIRSRPAGFLVFV